MKRIGMQLLLCMRASPEPFIVRSLSALFHVVNTEVLSESDLSRVRVQVMKILLNCILSNHKVPAEMKCLF